MRGTLLACVVTAIVTSALVGGVAWALQSPIDGNGVVHACYNPTTGAMSLNTKGACPTRGKTTPITWNAQGPQGPPGSDATANVGPVSVVDAENFTYPISFSDPLNTWVDIPGADLSVATTTAHPDLIVHIGATVGCLASGPQSFVQVLIDGAIVASPNGGQIDRGFAPGEFVPVTLIKHAGPLGPGAHDVKLQYLTPFNGIQCQVSDIVMQAQAI